MTAKLSVPVYSLDGQKKEAIKLPSVFATPYRPDVIHRVYVGLATHKLQRKGTNPEAGERTSAESNWPPTGHGISRVPRTKGERYPKAGVAAAVASVVGGRIPHPPKAERVVWKSVNKKERRLATASAISATANRTLVEKNGHRLSSSVKLPVVVDDEIEKISKAKDLVFTLSSLGVGEDLRRAATGKKIRQGKPRARGRGIHTPRGPLIIVSGPSPVTKVTGSLPGVESVQAGDLSVLNLAPGSKAGRLTIWSKSALNKIAATLLKISDRYEN